jgi:hypothetical protein
MLLGRKIRVCRDENKQKKKVDYSVRTRLSRHNATYHNIYLPFIHSFLRLPGKST